jgi:hypothetical protein
MLRLAVHVCVRVSPAVTVVMVASDVTSGAAVAVTLMVELPVAASAAVYCRLKVQVVLAAASVVAAHVAVTLSPVTTRFLTGTAPPVTVAVQSTS